MAGAIIEVKYFNTFLLKKTLNGTDNVVWNGSFGIPENIGGYPFALLNAKPENWVIEESRIRGGFNNTTVDFGAKAYIVEEEPRGTRRFNALIYSGIFNSRTGINRTNVFSVAEDITKAVDPANGSIQKLYAEDTNLNIFQELKVSRALIDKDAIFSAEGGGTVTTSNLVIGTIQPFAGKYGISTNPESFAVYGFRKYFADTNNGVICRLSSGGAGSGIEEISNFGMRDFFRDQLRSVNNAGGNGKIFGAYDIYGRDYVISMQNIASRTSTLNFDERAKGWVSFFDYKPDQMFSLRNNFYSVNTDLTGQAKLWIHYAKDVPRANFYGIQRDTSITFVVNPNPTNSKTFNTVGYEGSNGWKLTRFISDPTGPQEGVINTLGNLGYSTSVDSASNALSTPAWGNSYYEGEYILTEGSGASSSASATNSVVLDLSTINGIIRVGDRVYGEGVTNPTEVTFFSTGTGQLTVSTTLNIAEGAVLTFGGSVSRQDYLQVFGTNQPGFQRQYAGFVLKENKYVANIKNRSIPTPGEIVFGNQISGIKGFYALAQLSTDDITDPGGEKTLFSVETNYIMNNGY
mgnify:FL=1|jgi:hypothetical protein|tara:strand:+ start:511 stop:2235 length:1725 start_codon:yes stop_codon:yes gene_type:complete